MSWEETETAEKRAPESGRTQIPTFKTRAKIRAEKDSPLKLWPRPFHSHGLINQALSPKKKDFPHTFSVPMPIHSEEE